MSEVQDWSEIAEENSLPTPSGAPEGWRWRALAGTMREMMAATRRFYENPEWLHLVPAPTSRLSETEVKVQGLDVTGIFLGGEPVLLTAGATVSQHTVQGSVLSAGNTIVEVDAEVPSGCDGILLHIAPSLGSAAFRTVGTGGAELPLAQNVRAMTREIVQVHPVSADKNLHADFEYIRLNGSDWTNPAEANGLREFWLSLHLVVNMNILGGIRDRAVFLVTVGPTGTIFDPIAFRLRITEWGQDNTASQLDFVLNLPNIPLGLLAAGSRIALFGKSESGDFMVVHGETHTTDYSHMTLKAHL